MSATLRIRRMAEMDAEVVAMLAGELGYPSETEAIRVRIRAVGESDLLLVAVDVGRQGNRVYPGASGLHY